MNEDPDNPEAVSDTELDQAQGGLIVNLSVGAKETDKADSDTATNPSRVDPYRNFNFRVR